MSAPGIYGTLQQQGPCAQWSDGQYEFNQACETCHGVSRFSRPGQPVYLAPGSLLHQPSIDRLVKRAEEEKYMEGSKDLITKFLNQDPDLMSKTEMWQYCQAISQFDPPDGAVAPQLTPYQPKSGKTDQSDSRTQYFDYGCQALAALQMPDVVNEVKPVYFPNSDDKFTNDEEHNQFRAIFRLMGYVSFYMTTMPGDVKDRFPGVESYRKYCSKEISSLMNQSKKFKDAYQKVEGFKFRNLVEVARMIIDGQIP
jgi:hypothetical protein